MLQFIRKSKFAKIFSVFMAINILAEIFAPNMAFALTGGPSQPEVQSFEPVGTSDMVDLFSGDYNYNIPLLDVGGYPVNISYHSGISMDQEASWVGLGWNINAGVINRNMRGLPDDFAGDPVVKKFNMEPNRTYGGGAKLGFELWGLSKQKKNNGSLALSLGVGISYNNYTGVGYERSVNPSFTSFNGGKSETTYDLGITSGSRGLSLTPSVSFSKKMQNKDHKDLKLGGSIGLSFNSRAGLQALNLSATSKVEDAKASFNYKKKDKDGNVTKHKGSVSINGSNGGSSISFGTQTYVPQVNMPMRNAAVSFSLKLGADIIGADVTGNFSGYYSEQRLIRNEETAYAYGYFNTSKGAQDESSLLDFNREKDGAFNYNTPGLPLTNFSYDIYSVSGQGVGGMYRPFRGDIGYVYDRRNTSISTSGSLGVEIASGNLLKGGADVTINDLTTTSGPWVTDNNAASLLTFKGEVANKPLYESYYLKEAGEKTVDTDPNDLYASTGGSEPVRIKLKNGGGLNVDATQSFENSGNASFNIPSKNYREERNKRNQNITILTASEAAAVGLEDTIYSYQENVFINPTITKIQRVSGTSTKDRKSHHASEITTTKPDGSRYVFGIPAYNTYQKEVTFNATGRSVDCYDGLVTYNPSENDNNTGNKRGLDHYFSSTELPAYAHSYLLTAVLSADYVDVTGDGPSDDDLGTYTKFNYTRTTSDYKWRVPVGTNKANYNQGLRSDMVDDQGNYIYGEKEVWYLHSIVTKNYVAEYNLSNRDDGKGVTGENGTVGGTALRRLDKISLYSKPERKAKGTNAVPIKEVHFVYDYSLAKGATTGVPNNTNNEGKLTLKQLYFTYGKSYKTRLSPYKFTYSTFNPEYNLKSYDRWGYYKPNGDKDYCGDISNYGSSIGSTSESYALSNAEFPYVEQNKTNADQYATAWCLKSIELPSGGKINMEYESDDYAYVQNKRAMQMFKVIALGSNPAVLGTSKELMTSSNTINNILYFKLNNTIPDNASNIPSLLSQYFTGIDKLYFRFFVDISNRKEYEFVSGYAEIDKSNNGGYGVIKSNPGNSFYDCGWVALKNVPIGDLKGSADVHPISKAAWQYGRLNTPRIVWDEPDPTSSEIEQVIKAMANSSFFKNIVETFKGPNRTIRDKGYGKKTIVNGENGSPDNFSRSWIRLNNPAKNKLGGGSRVKRVAISDSWKDLLQSSNNADNFEYGQEYSYTTTESGTTISSGVASYEPMAGGDENPWRKPVYLNIRHLLAPNDENYMEEPFGESFFPSPSVGYSRITVRNLKHTGVKRHATGHVVHEFYTAKDFPTVVKKTGMNARPPKKAKNFQKFLKLFKIINKDYVTASQGYSIELNDMHGKPKAQWVYGEAQDTPISGVEYFYKTQPNNKSQLDNQVVIMDKSGNAPQRKNAGLDYEVVADMREHYSEGISVGLNGNLAGFILAVFPGLVPSILPSMSKEYTRFRSAVVTKVINRYGILERTVAHDLGSIVSTENLAYDGATGEVLLTKTKNDFEDNVYNFTYPAHWGYEMMGSAYYNAGTVMTSPFVASAGSVTITNGYNVFRPGDEILFYGTGGTPYRGWICSVNDYGTNADITVLNRNGQFIGNGTYQSYLKIIRSGKRNQQNTPIGMVTSLVNPIDTANTGVLHALKFKEVVNTSAVEFSQKWQMEFGKTQTNRVCDCTFAQHQRAAIKKLISQLNTNDSLIAQNVLLFNDGNYYNGFNSFFKEPVFGTTSPPEIVWTSSISGSNNNVLNATIACISSCDTTKSSECGLTLDIPTQYSWNDLIAFGSDTMVTPYPENCATTRQFRTKATFLYQGDTVEVIVRGDNSCFNLVTCDEIFVSTTKLCGKVADPVADTVNPYVTGVRGNWRPQKSYLYLSDRTSTADEHNTGPFDANTNIRKDGTFITYLQNSPSIDSVIDFQTFWRKPTGSGYGEWGKNNTYWTYTSEVTKFHPSGFEVENRDALGRYSSALYGYKNTLPIAVASNAKYQQIAFDGFEDYRFYDLNACNNTHFNFLDHIADTTSQEAHTGLYSIKAAPNDTFIVRRKYEHQTPSTGSDNCTYTLKGVDNVGIFAPDRYNGTKKYILSYWVKQNVDSTTLLNYPDAEIEVIGSGSSYKLVDVRRGAIIEGWQHVEVEFTLYKTTSGYGYIDFTIVNRGTHNAYFDDIRIHPFNSNMKSFVYHPVTLRLMAELDENNYATLYEYDEEGALMRVKKETERGIMTIKESRNNTRKK